MKKKNLDKMFNLIDDDILSEADPTKPKIKSISKFGWAQIVAGAACLILTLNMLVFAPFMFLGDNGNKNTDPPSTDVIDLPGSDTESKTEAETETDTEIDSSVSSDTDTDEPNVPNDTESNEPEDTDSNEIGDNRHDEQNKPNDTESDEPSKPNDTDDSSDTGVKFEYIGSITNIHIPVPGKGTHTISLSAPLTNAPSQYKDIIASMQEIADGDLGGDVDADKNLSDKNETMKDEIEDITDQSKTEEELEYKETTDNQVSGIIEGDIIKRSSKYVYYLSGSTLKIYPMNGKETTVLTEFDLKDYIKAIEKSLKIPYNPPENELPDRMEEINDTSRGCLEMFLSTDCKTITIITGHYISQYYYSDDYDGLEENEYSIIDGKSGTYTSLISLNVEDPENVYLNDITTLFGAYESARLVDGEFLVFTKFTPRLEELIVPQFSDGNGFEYIELENIYSPNKYTNYTYLLSFKIDGESYDILNSGAYASFDGEIYVTDDNIFVTRQYENEERVEEKYPIFKEGETDSDPLSAENIIGYGTKTTVYRKTATEILRIDYSSGKFIRKSSVLVDGYIKDRYSMSENGDFLYVVTTVDEKTYSVEIFDEDVDEYLETIDFLWDKSIARSASLFVIDLEAMEKISSVERFAPDGELVRSVRFDGYYAYVCTAVQTIDPVFFFDLTNPYDIKYSDTGTIPGFSVNLIELPNGELLGIGTDGSGHVKFETYRWGENNTIEIVDTYLVKATSYSGDYKAHFIDRENGFFGVGIKDWRQSNDGYVVVQYMDGSFTKVFDCALTGTNDSKRVIYDKENDLFYLFASNGFLVVEPTIE